MDKFFKKIILIAKIREIQAFCNYECKKYDDITKCEEPCEDIKEYFEEEE